MYCSILEESKPRTLARQVEESPNENLHNADWDGFVNDKRSTSGYCTFVGGNLVILQSNKQPIVARLRAEAEFHVVENRIYEILWIRGLLRELGFSS